MEQSLRIRTMFYWIVITFMMNFYFKFSSGSTRSQKLVFSARDVEDWRYIATVGKNDTSFIYVLNTTKSCIRTICSDQCNLTIIPHDDLSYLNSGTLNCYKRFQYCRIESNNKISFSVYESCPTSSGHVLVAVRDNILNTDGTCGQEEPSCLRERLAGKETTTSNTRNVDFSTETSTTKNLEFSTDFKTSSTKLSITMETTDVTTTKYIRDNIANTTEPYSGSDITMNNTIIDSEPTTFPLITNGSDSTNHATPRCCIINKTPSSKDNRREISQQDMDIALGVTISISVLVVSFMLFMIGRLLYKTRHVKRLDPPINSFDIGSPSDGDLENPGGFIHETYIHIRKVSESNTDESPVSSPHGHAQDPNFGMVTSDNSQSHYGRYSTFTGRQQADDVVPHRCSVHGDRGAASRPRK